jgi:hypothetical protein
LAHAPAARVQRGSTDELFNLASFAEKPFLDAAIEWVAKVTNLSPRVYPIL